MNDKQNMIVGLGIVLYLSALFCFGLVIATNPILVHDPVVAWGFGIMTIILITIITAFGLKASFETEGIAF